MTEAEKKAKKKYSAKVKRILLEFYPTEDDLIEHVEKQFKKQTYIKDLIRKDMESKNPKTIESIMANAERESNFIKMKNLMAEHERWKATHTRKKEKDK